MPNHVHNVSIFIPASQTVFGVHMSVTTSVLSLFAHARFSIAKAFGVLSLGLLVSLALPQLALAQTQVTNTASISVPAGITNTGVGCASGTCTAADVDTVTASVPLVSKTFSPRSLGGRSLLMSVQELA
jgi:hypothetical protein